ncbi:MAG: hypothetical protein JWQ40_3775 [Segetibacter sp.]|nr:hypothetical protein [Segetibacter sp.]
MRSQTEQDGEESFTGILQTLINSILTKGTIEFKPDKDWRI